MTATDTHWMQLHTMKSWVSDIILPDYTRTCAALGLEAGAQKAIIKIDVYSVHICAEFRRICAEFRKHIPFMTLAAYGG